MNEINSGSVIGNNSIDGIDQNQKSPSRTTTSNSTTTSNTDIKEKNQNTSNNKEKYQHSKLPWGVVKEKPNLSNNLISLLNANNSLISNDEFVSIEKRKPGEYLMHLVVLNFIQLGSKKMEQIVIGEKRDKSLKECFQKNEDPQFDKLIATMGQVAEQSLPSLIITLLRWHKFQMDNLSYLRKQNQPEFNTTSTTSKIALKARQQIIQAKKENDILDERRELVVKALLCISLIEISKQLPFHPGIDDLLNYIIDLSFQRFLSKENHLTSSLVQHNQNYLDNQYVTDLFSECIGVLAQSRFSLIKRRFCNEFNRLKPSSSSSSSTNQTNCPNLILINNVQSAGANMSNLTNQQSFNPILNQSLLNTASSSQIPSSSSSILTNSQTISSSNQSTGVSSLLTQNANNFSAPNLTQQSIISPTSSTIIKLFMGMKHFRIKMVPIEDFEASFQFLNEWAQYFVDVKDKDIKHTLAGLFVEILVPITGIVKNEVNIPCLKMFVDILYQHAWELSAKTKHRLATIPLLTCLLCVSQKQFFLNYWFQFAQLCFQQFKSKEQTLSRISLEAILRLVWVYMIRIKGEKSSDTNQRLNTIIQTIFPKGNKLVIPKEMPANIYVKIINYIAYEKLDFAFKEIIYELLSIDLNSNSINSTNNIEQTDSNQINSFNPSNNSSLNTNISNFNQLNQINSGRDSIGSSSFKTNTIIPLRMEIGLKSFVLIADTLQQQKETGANSPAMPSTFYTPNNDILSIYLNKNSNTQRVCLTDSLAKEIGLGIYFDNVRRAFQDILKTLDFTIGRNFLMTRPENTGSSLLASANQIDGLDSTNQTSSGISSAINSNNSSLNLQSQLSSSNSSVNSSVGILSGQNNPSNLSSSVNRDVNIISPNQLNNKNLDDLNSSTNALNQSSKDLIFNSDNKSRLSLFRTCIALVPRIMPLFKENELVDILTRLTIHLDDELKLISFQTIKTLVNDYPQWRKHVFFGFTNFIYKEITDMYPKLIENALKMIIQLINIWKASLSTSSTTQQNLDDCSRIIYHLEGFSLFNLCHSHIHRRRLALIILKECKIIGELTKCFKFYPFHNYTIDVLDLATVYTMKQMHLLCFNTNLIAHNTKPDLGFLIEQSANWDHWINLSKYNNNDSNSLSSNAPSSSVSSGNTQSQVSSSNSTFLNIMSKNQRASSISSSTQNVANPISAATSVSTVIDTNDEQNELAGSNTSNTNNSSNQNETDIQALSTNQQSTTASSITNSTITGLSQTTHTQATHFTNSSSQIFTFDPWTECLAIFFSYDFIFTKCPQARAQAWPFINNRLHQILPFVDPNEQPHERTSIFGVGSNSLEKLHKAKNERDINLNLWKNYLIGACCLTSGSDHNLYYQEYEKALIKTDESSELSNLSTQSNLNMPNQSSSNNAINADFTLAESSFKSNMANSSPSFLKLIVPYLKCENSYFREIIIRGLGRINIETIRDLIEELNPYIKDSLDKRQEKLRRMKKKDWIRLSLIRIFELMSEQRTLGKRITDTLKKISQLKYQPQDSDNESQLRKTFNDYIEGMHSYLDQEADKHSDTTVHIKLHFSMFLHKLVDSVSRDKRSFLFTEIMRNSLFNLCDKWSGRFRVNQYHEKTNQPSASRIQSNSNETQISRSNPNHLYLHQYHSHYHDCYHYYEELEFAATRACAAILCCGFFTNKQNPIVFTWLSQLVENANVEMKMYDYCKSTLPNEIYMISLNVCIQLLESSLYNYLNQSNNNQSLNMIDLSLNNSPIFDWIIKKCYSSISEEIADLCYIALAKVYLDYLNNSKQNYQFYKNNQLKACFDSMYLGPILTLVLLNIGSSKLNIHETSICLLRAINKTFLQEDNLNLFDSKTEASSKHEQNNSKNSTVSSSTSTNNLNNQNVNFERQESFVSSLLNIDFDIINSMVIYSKSQAFISEYIAKKNPEQTLYIFCEITSRFEECTSYQVRRTMLNVLVPWFYNLELIDPNVISQSDSCKTNAVNNVLSLQSGYGSVEGTHLILNNLFYLTCKFTEQFSSEFELLWAILASTWRSNLKIICRFIFVMVSLAPYEVLNHSKKIICYISRVCPERIVDELVNELEMIESFNNILDKCENTLPFYRYNRPATIPPSPPPSPKPETNNQINKKKSIYFVNQNDEDDEDEMDDESIEFINQSDLTNFDDDDDESDYDSDEYDEEDDEDEDDDSDSSDNEESDSNLEEEKEKKLNQIKGNLNKFNQQQTQQLKPNQQQTQQNTNKLNTDSSRLPLPSNHQSYECPLNVLLFHIGHHHYQHTLYNHQAPIYSYHNNYWHPNHYQHLNHLQRGSISLMLFTELVCNDGADFDWTEYLPILFHFCLINFDNTKQIIGEHAKKLFLGLIYIITVQNELYYLTDYLIESVCSIVDNQSIIFDRKYTTSNLNENPNLLINNLYNMSSNNARLSVANCHYSYNFNMRIFSANLKGYSNNLLTNNITLMSSPSHRNLINMHSAPSSPSQNQNNIQNLNQSNSKTEKMKSNIKKINKLQKAKEHLSALLNILAKCKNSPVWPHELITPQNYSKPLTSVQILNDFVVNLKSFLHICFSSKQISTISSTRSFSSPLNLTSRFDSTSEKCLNQIDKKWANYALTSSLFSLNRHYAGRSLQIYRALGLKISSFSTMIDLIQRLKETVTEFNEDVQGYVTEILLTLKMNAALLSNEYVSLINRKSEVSKLKEPTAKQKSKSLKVKQEKVLKKEELVMRKKSSTAIGSELSSKFNNLDMIKAKTATLSRKQINQYVQNTKMPEKRLSMKYKHQISYRKCLTLSLFNYKWQLLQDRVGSSILNNKKKAKFFSYYNNLNTLNKTNQKAANSNLGGNQNHEDLRLLVHIFWTSICLLESDFEHEFVLAIEIIEQILSKIDLNSGLSFNNHLQMHKNEFRTNLELFGFRITEAERWSSFPGLQNLLMKGCTSQSSLTFESTQRLLVNLIPYCSKLNFVDPFGSKFYGLLGVSMNLLALLPTMILNYENPNELCIRAAEQYCKVINEQIKLLEDLKPVKLEKQENNSNCKAQKSVKIEQLKNLNHVINLYMTRTFGKDRTQWTKCVVTYMSEFFYHCQQEQASDEQTSHKSVFYFDWIVFLIELLEKNTANNQYQSCVLVCLSSLLNYLNFNDQATWAFINEELLRVVVKFINTPLWTEALDLIKLTVSKSSSLISLDSQKQASPRFFLSDSSTQHQTSQMPISTHSLIGKKELPGRTLDFEFDFSLFIPPQQLINPKSPSTSPNNQQPISQTTKKSSSLQLQQQANQNNVQTSIPPLNLINLHSNKQFGFLNHYLSTFSNTLGGWKRPHLSQSRTRDRLFILYSTLTNNQTSNSLGQTNDNTSSDNSAGKSPSVIFENSLNSSENQKDVNLSEQQEEPEENLNLITNTTFNNESLNINNQINNNINSNVNTSSSSSSSNTTSSTKSTTTNQTSSTNSSFNQTLFVFSPEKDGTINKKSDEFNKFLKPTIAAKQIVSVLPDQMHRNTHNRTMSVSITKPGSIVSIIGSGKNTFPSKASGLSLSNMTPGVSQQILNTIDDNIFINNTFSFLDDLDSNAGDFMIMNENMNSINKQLNENKNSKEKDNMSIDENFPWHAILPTNEQQPDNEKYKNESSTDILSNSYTSSNSSHLFDSKLKQVAPKIKGSATIGATTGITLAKNINSISRNIRDHAEYRNDSSDGSKQDFQSNKSIDLDHEQKRSVTRIVSSDNLNNFNNIKNSPQSSNSINNSNSNLTNKAEFEVSQKILNSSYRPTVVRTSNSKSPRRQSSESNISNKLLTNKNSSLKISSVGNLSHFTSAEDQMVTTINLLSDKQKLVIRNNYNNVLVSKSMTLPNKPNLNQSINKNDDSSQSNASSLISLIKVVNETNDELKNQSQLSLAKTIKILYEDSFTLNNLLNIEPDEIEDIWKLHIQTMLNKNKTRTSTNKLDINIENETKNFNPIETFYLFRKLFRATRCKLEMLLSECYHYLSRDTNLFSKIEKHLVNILELINTKLDCPVIYFDQEWFLKQQREYSNQHTTIINKVIKSPLQNKNSDSVSPLFIDNHKRILWEIGENYDTFSYIKHGVTESLEAIKKIEKNLSNSSSSSQNEINNKIERFFKKIDLSKLFCKLISQFMILLQSYSKLLPNLSKYLENITITDMSIEISRLKKSLTNAFKQLENDGRLSPLVLLNLDDSNLNNLASSLGMSTKTKEFFIYLILESIKEENYTSALEYFMQAQKHWPNEFYKSNQTSNDLDFDLVLLLVCEQARLKHSNLVVIIDSEEDYNDISQIVLQENMEITNLINSIDKKFKENISSVLNDDDDDVMN